MMAKRTLWQWLFDLMAQPAQEPRQPMAVPNTPARGALVSGCFGCKPMAESVSLTEGEWNEVCSGGVQVILQKPWHPGIEHTQPHPVKENQDGTLYYKGKVYRMIGERRNNKNKRRQG